MKRNYIKKLHENGIEGQYIDPYRTFLVTFDTIKLNLFMRNDPVKIRENIASDDEEASNNSESSSNKKKEAKEKVVAPIFGKSHHLNNISRHKS